MTAATQTQATEQELDAVNVVAETVGGILASKAKDQLTHLRWLVARVEHVEVFALTDERSVPVRLLVRAFALVGDEPVGGMFLVDDDGVRLLSTEQVLDMAVGGAMQRWVGLPMTGIAAMPRGALLGLRQEAPNVARAVEALLQTAV